MVVRVGATSMWVSIYKFASINEIIGLESLKKGS